MEKIKFIDLFAGTGAFSLSFEKNDRFKCVFTNDMMECSKKIYELNNPNNKFTLKDLNKIDVSEIPSHDILCGGFPCQPFSSAGHKKGFSDKRGGMIFKIIDLCKYHKPSIIILENVYNLITLEKGNCIKKINDLFESEKKAEMCFNKSLYKLCWKYFSTDKKMSYNTKDICKIRKQIKNC